REGIAYLQSLLALLIPEETRLLPNYPNPFNPETWIPYQLSEPAGVTVRIYSVNGVLVRTLVLGHIPAGIYQSRNRAAYWNGRNEIGEPVASGLYFYTLTAGDFTATRKMLIRK
ncbi:T9SS type A sorting domain-containing protein, partial [Candidatus Poribacteria bacterium]|nr:T9SS type A sorting domain-containing protein [Candidatus Poribacteria bacterium]MYA57568.1 T9SS type A sorting domain-containing protein [Candidatus Poribacteria bacterium]